VLPEKLAASGFKHAGILFAAVAFVNVFCYIFSRYCRIKKENRSSPFARDLSGVTQCNKAPSNRDTEQTI
jgi:hypothetical protein